MARTQIEKVSNACDRCKKQKLKCDVARPCTLCLRSRVTCTSSSAGPRRARITRRKQVRNDNRKLGCPRPNPAHPRRQGDHEQLPCAATKSFSNIPSLSPSELSTPIISSLTPSAEVSRTEAQFHNGQETTNTSQDLHTPPAEPSQSRIYQPEYDPRDSFTGDSSAIGLTREVFSFNDSHTSSSTSALPGGVDLLSEARIVGRKLTSYALFPPIEVAEALISEYFDTVHWFMCVLHEPSFRDNSRRLLKQEMNLTAEETDFAVLLMMVMALGAQYASKNPEWKYKPLLQKYAIDLTTLNHVLIGHVRAHLLDSLERCQVETVQVCVLLGTFYLYHGNPSLGWSILGMAVKSGHALAMHREVDWRGNDVLLQIRKRAWAHTTMTDTFAAVVYGRPSVVDRSFCDVSLPDEFDDMVIPLPLREYAESLNDGRPLSRMTYLTQRYHLYELNSQIVKNVFTLRARALFSLQIGGVEKLVSTVQSLDEKLREWYQNLPAFFKRHWRDSGSDPFKFVDSQREALPESQESIKRQLRLQAISLQVSYDNTLLVLHRPLLEYKMSAHKKGQSPNLANSDPFAYSFDTCIKAALEISRTPLVDFQYDLPLSLISMFMFNSGVILCIPATTNPFSQLAHRAKGSVVRIIRVFKKLSMLTPIAAQSHTILEELMKAVLRKELDMVLQPGDSEQNYEEDVAFHTDKGIVYSGQSHHDLTTNLDSASNAVLQSSDAGRNSHSPQVDEGVTASCISHQNQQQSWGADAHLPAISNAYSPASGNPHSGVYSAYDPLMSSVSSHEECGDGQLYSDIGAEPNYGLNSAFEAIEKVIYDFAPSDWLEAGWMTSYESNQLESGNGLGKDFPGAGSSSADATPGVDGCAQRPSAITASLTHQPSSQGRIVSTGRPFAVPGFRRLAEPGPSWLWGLNRIA